MRLTKRTVDAASASDKIVIVWDDELRGFGLRITPNGIKSYILNYRVGHGRNAPLRRITIGKHGSPWTPEAARREAMRLRGAITTGADPVTERKAVAKAMTLAELCEFYLSEGTRHKKPSTLKSDVGRLRNHVLPLLGRRRIDQITRADVERMLIDVSAGKTASSTPRARPRGSVAKGGHGTAGQALAVLGAVMSFAMGRGLIDANPVRGIKKPPIRKMERFLSEAEIARLGEALEAEAAKSGDPYPAAAIRLLLFTGCRRSEILGLRWDWIDFERAMIFLPDSKTGKKPVYLNAPALDVLAGLPRIGNNPFVIAGRREGGAYVGIDKVWRRIRAASGLPGLRIHDLRHSFASLGAAGGNSLLVLGKLLGHRHAATTERYSHLGADPMRQAAEMIGRKIAAAFGGRRSEIVPLPKTRQAR